jgi:hypothetical protein
LCAGPIEFSNAAPVTGEVPRALPSIEAEREWYAEPAQVFDDLFFLGQTAFSVWGLRLFQAKKPGGILFQHHI